MTEKFLVELDLNVVGAEQKVFRYELRDAFWNALDQNEILGGDVEVCIEARRTAGDIFNIAINAQGAVETLCDRCLERMSLPVCASDMVRASYGSADEWADEDMLTPMNRSSKLDLAWLIYEIVVTSLPTTRFHKDGECNEEMTKRISTGGDDSSR